MHLDDFWAKTNPFQSVRTHGLVSGFVAKSLFEQYLAPGTRKMLCAHLGLEEETSGKFVAYLSSLHDIGKLEPSFQSKDNEVAAALKYGGLEPAIFYSDVRHENTSKEILQKIWPRTGVHSELAMILGAHHQGKSGHKALKDLKWQEFREVYEHEMREFFLGTDSFPKLDSFGNYPGCVQAILLGLVIMSDWIASSDVFSCAQEWADAGTLNQRVSFVLTDFLEHSGLLASPIEWGTHFNSIWPNISEDSMRPLQTVTEELFFGTDERFTAVLIEAPMGEGKTEAAIYAATQMMKQWGKIGYYVAMPTAATSNQMVDRMRSFLKQQNILSDKVHLLHSMAWLTDSLSFTGQDFDDVAATWLQPVRKGLLAPYAVGTVDQVMLAVSRAKYSVLRLLGLGQKVLIIDEIHSYDVYMSQMLHLLLKWCKAMEIPVILLSATLTLAQKKKLLDAFGDDEISQVYPAITAVSESGRVTVLPVQKTHQQSTVKVDCLPILYHPLEIAHQCLSALDTGGCACILMNTVGQAQEVYREIKMLGFDGELLLFHSRFPVNRRKEIEEKCIQLFGRDKTLRPSRAILVATQVVEQSLDVDFDVMFTAVAPIDLVLQRLGRVHRHRETVRPVSLVSPRVFILIPSSDEGYKGDKWVYADCLLSRSVELLGQISEIRIPEDMSYLVEQGYDSKTASVENQEAWLNYLVEQQVHAAKGKEYCIHFPGKSYAPLRKPSIFSDEESDSFLSVQTRLGLPSVRVALVYDKLFEKVRPLSYLRDGKFYVDITDRVLAREIMEHSVSLPQNQVVFDSSVEHIYCKHLLAGTIVVNVSSGNVQLTRGNSLFYDPEMGVNIISL